MVAVIGTCATVRSNPQMCPSLASANTVPIGRCVHELSPGDHDYDSATSNGKMVLHTGPKHYVSLPSHGIIFDQLHTPSAFTRRWVWNRGLYRI
jgi:hypothetical protein